MLSVVCQMSAIFKCPRRSGANYFVAREMGLCIYKGRALTLWVLCYSSLLTNVRTVTMHAHLGPFKLLTSYIQYRMRICDHIDN